MPVLQMLRSHPHVCKAGHPRHWAHFKTGYTTSCFRNNTHWLTRNCVGLLVPLVKWPPAKKNWHLYMHQSKIIGSGFKTTKFAMIDTKLQAYHHLKIYISGIFCNGGHGSASLPTLGFCQTKICRHAHYHRFHQVFLKFSFLL